MDLTMEQREALAVSLAALYTRIQHTKAYIKRHNDELALATNGDELIHQRHVEAVASYTEQLEQTERAAAQVRAMMGLADHY